MAQNTNGDGMNTNGDGMNQNGQQNGNNMNQNEVRSAETPENPVLPEKKRKPSIFDGLYEYVFGEKKTTAQNAVGTSGGKKHKGRSRAKKNKTKKNKTKKNKKTAKKQ